MIVWLSPGLFEKPGQDLALIGLFEHGFRGHHRVQTELDHPAVRAWLERQSQDVREACELATDHAAQEESLHPSTSVVTVIAGASSDWSSSPPSLTLADARGLLARPFEIYVEDASSDRAFLRKMMTPEELELVDELESTELESTERLRFVHGGGSRLKLLVEQRAKDPKARLQTWVLIDSDAMAPARPSNQAVEVYKVCSIAGIPCYRLERRFIESYLPLDALDQWAKAIPSKREVNLKLVRAYGRMSAMQRHHFNMKKGFAKDASRRAETGDLYEDLSARDRERLDNGFGADIGVLFQDRHPGDVNGLLEGTQFVSERALRRDGGWDELRPVIRGLFAQLGVS